MGMKADSDDLRPLYLERASEGYSIEPRDQPDGRVIDVLCRRSAAKTTYRLEPFGEHAGLFRTFASLDRTSTKAILSFAEEYGFLWQTGNEEHVESWQTAIRAMAEVVVACDLKEYEYVWERFNDGRIHAQFSIRIEPYEKRWDAKLTVVPYTLLAAMWLQVATHSVRATQFRQCESCLTWFPIGPGTGGRSTKRFCSPRCRVKWNRQHKSGAAK